MKCPEIVQLTIVTLLTDFCFAEISLWAKWWTYRGISGPKYWGVLNPQWRLCSLGKRQSPINIDMGMLLFDPSLGELEVQESRTSGLLMNNGNEVTLKINDSSSDGIFFTSGPLSYKYRVQFVKFHMGSEGMDGGEHQIGGLTFPGELQIMAYNCDLYDNFTQAERSPHGITGIAVFVQVAENENEDFDILAHSMSKVRFQGQFVTLNKLKISWLLPNTTHFLTYEGSLTQPGCYETVTWVIMNRPVYVSQRQLELLNSLNKGGFEDTQMLLEPNSRPVRPVNHRVIRTNINFKRGCTMARNITFEVNGRYKH